MVSCCPIVPCCQGTLSYHREALNIGPFDHNYHQPQREPAMPRYEISFERKAVQIRRIMLDAETEEAAIAAATAFIQQGKGLIVHLSEECYPDEESVWEQLDSERTV